MPKFFNDRYKVFGAFLLVISIIITFQLINLQIVSGEEYSIESQKKLLREQRIVAPRGNIFDRNGIPIATNRISYTVDLIKTNEDSDTLNTKLLRLVNIFEKNNDNYSNLLSKYLEIDPVGYGPYLKNSKSVLARWKKDMVGDKTEDLESLKTAKDMFNYLKEKFGIDETYDDNQAYKIMTLRYEILIKGYSILDELNIARDVSKETISEISEKGHNFNGIITDVEPIRKYLEAESIAHVVGYVANLNSDEYEKLKKDDYYMTDLIGKAGIEKSKEKDLRGKDGLKSVEVDIFGNESTRLNIEPAIPGKDVTLSLDLKLQKVAMNSLKLTIDQIRNGQVGGEYNNHDAYFGSVVAIDVETGEVLVMASHPSYDPAIFSADKSDEKAQNEIAALFNPKNKKTSSYNRVISGVYPPGSTFKPLIGLAALQENIINKNTTINDPGMYIEEGVKMTCLEWRRGEGEHGDLTLKTGLKTSCNVFFYKLGVMIGIDKINKWAKIMGLGELTGIDIGGESKGMRSTPEFHEENFNYKFGNVLTSYSSIGQGYNIYSPMQLVGYTSTLANGGFKLTPHLVKSISDETGTDIEYTKVKKEDLKIKKENLNIVKEGMIAVANDEGGTATSVFKDFPYTVAAKTGTAETGNKTDKQSDNAVFIAYAPAESPKIAVSIVIEHGVYGSYSAPIARSIFAEYFKQNSESTSSKSINSNNFKFTK
ncbi:MAG: penicillin-binding protein 2 [Clostridiales bacterium]